MAIKDILLPALAISGGDEKPGLLMAELTEAILTLGKHCGGPTVSEKFVERTWSAWADRMGWTRDCTLDVARRLKKSGYLKTRSHSWYASRTMRLYVTDTYMAELQKAGELGFHEYRKQRATQTTAPNKVAAHRSADAAGQITAHQQVMS